MNPETGEKPNTSSPVVPPSFLKYLWPAYAKLLRKSSRPILVGPWRGEVGFEALYWLPFLDAFRQYYKIAQERIIPISRGGMGALYNAPKYIELYAMRSPEDLRVENRMQHVETRMLKQYSLTAWDKAVLADVAKTLGIKKYHVLHPGWMFHSLTPFWEGDKGTQWLKPKMLFPFLPTIPLPEGMTLPEKFVAVRFYARSTFPMCQITADVARETIKTLAQTQPVILLDSNFYADDHQDFCLKEPMGNVTKLSDLTTLAPDNNLAVQAAVLARSVGFVGTYGGIAQLALRFKKPTVSLYTEWGGTAWAHRHLSEQLAHWSGVSFLVHRIGDLPLLQSALPRFSVQ